ncbi:MAG: hypothetical protein J6Q53_01255 [Oscillospiraceae bacterium]|nr:hypothetical protein [Oscillospiraceae bacterium]
MCDHKPKFYKYYFANKFVKSISNMKKEQYTCRFCGQAISIVSKYGWGENVFRVLGHCSMPVLLAVVGMCNIYNSREIKVMNILIATIAYILAEIIIGFFWFSILRFESSADGLKGGQGDKGTVCVNPNEEQ